MTQEFYRRFEDRFRGARETIRKRLDVYRPLLTALAGVYPGGAALDIGCGRGEWLEVLDEAGFKAQGVDLDESMLAICRGLELDVRQGDGIGYLKSLEDASLAMVSAIHVVEHLPFDQVRVLAAEALRTLKPGGILLLETPNPENIVVATREFYFDPTHRNPVPAELLSFVAEDAGFGRTRIVRLHQAVPEGQAMRPGIFTVLSGPSRDYALVAQKPAKSAIASVLDEVFSGTCGVSLDMLADRHDRFMHECVGNLEAGLSAAAQRSLEFEATVQAMDARLAQDENRQGETEERIGQAEARVAESERQIWLAQIRQGDSESRISQAEVRVRELESNQVAMGNSNREIGAWAKELESRLLEAQAKLEEREQEIAFSQGFYHAFQERFRGPRQNIIARLQLYRPFVEPLAGLYPGAAVLDIGCGRGEWLEVMSQLGFRVTGIDLDPVAVDHVRNLGFNALSADGLAFLRELGSGSQAIVSALHVAEHLRFEQLNLLVAEALRVLQPGGLLILETPNPDNILVSSQYFYQDPSHINPIPSELLAFLPTYQGFARVKVAGLQESERRVDGALPSLMDVLEGVSPDYAVIAQKEASALEMASFDDAFNRPYGNSLHDVVRAYDSHVDQHVRGALHALAAIQDSRSWRITAPLRWVGLQIRLFRQYGARERLLAAVRKIGRPAILPLAEWASRRPLVRRVGLGLLRRAGLYERVSRIRQRLAGAPASPFLQQVVELPPDLIGMTVTTRRVHAELKAALARRGGGAE